MPLLMLVMIIRLALMLMARERRRRGLGWWRRTPMRCKLTMRCKLEGLGRSSSTPAHDLETDAAGDGCRKGRMM